VAALVGSVTRGRSSRPATDRAVSMALPPPVPTITSVFSARPISEPSRFQPGCIPRRSARREAPGRPPEAAPPERGGGSRRRCRPPGSAAVGRTSSIPRPRRPGPRGAARTAWAKINIGHSARSVLGMISQLQRHRVRVQVHLLLEVRLVVLAYVMVQQGDGTTSGRYSLRYWSRTSSSSCFSSEVSCRLK